MFFFLVFLSIFTFVVFISSTAFSYSPEDFADTRNKALSLQEIDPAFVEKYLGEMTTIYKHQNPVVDPSIQYVWGLAGRSSYLKEPVNS